MLRQTLRRPAKPGYYIRTLLCRLMRTISRQNLCLFVIMAGAAGTTGGTAGRTVSPSQANLLQCFLLYSWVDNPNDQLNAGRYLYVADREQPNLCWLEVREAGHILELPSRAQGLLLPSCGYLLALFFTSLCPAKVLYSAPITGGSGKGQTCLHQVPVPSVSWPFVLGQVSPLFNPDMMGETGSLPGTLVDRLYLRQ